MRRIGLPFLIAVGLGLSHAGAAVLCVKKNGTVLLRDVACGVKEGRLDPEQYGLRGPAGPPGDPGPSGQPGAPASAWWGYINPDGSLGYGSGITAATKSGNGTYLVSFERAVQNCAAFATLSGVSGEIGVTASDEDSFSLTVSTRRSNGGATNAAFYVTMFCR